MQSVIRYRILAISLVFSFLSPTAWAATRTAESCSYAHVKTTYDLCSSGDILSIPAGSCTWSTGDDAPAGGLAVSIGITIQGAGSTQTAIANDNTLTQTFNVALSTDVAFRVTGIHFDNTSANQKAAIVVTGPTLGACTKQTRIDNNKFSHGMNQVTFNKCVYGVTDNNTFLNGDISVRFNGDSSYAWTNTGDRAIAAGTASAMFIESNTFTVDNDFSAPSQDQSIYHQDGARSVTRYNTFDASAYSENNYTWYDSHGNWGSPVTQYRGQPILEVYNNTITAHHTYGFCAIRGGSTLIYNNTFSYATGSVPYTCSFREEETWSEGGPWCPTCPVDTEWPATDQINNSFWWNNTLNGAANSPYIVSPDSGVITENQDYFLAAPAASGGKETLGNGGTTTSDMTFSASGANAYYPYTPYTYPHPLRGEGEEDTTDPEVTISTSDPSAITSDSLSVTGTASDAVGVSSCKFRLGSAPDGSNGTSCTGTTSWTCATSGYSLGANTLYVGCGDAAGNWGSDSITVNYSVTTRLPWRTN